MLKLSTKLPRNSIAQLTLASAIAVGCIFGSLSGCGGTTGVVPAGATNTPGSGGSSGSGGSGGGTGGGTGSGGGSSQPPFGVYTSRYDQARSGLNSNETKLTLQNVGTSFGKLKALSLDGPTFTQPLYVPAVSVNGASHNVVIVGTEHDSLYAFDADDGTQLWKRSFLENGATTLSDDFNHGRTGLGPEVGITGTPVIDPTSGHLYVATMTVESGSPHWRLHAVDITSGNDVMSAAEIAGSVSGSGTGSQNGTVTFQPEIQNQRTGLALANNVVYVPFSSYSDLGPYHGWVFAFDASSLKMIDVFNTSPDGEGSAIWEGGTAPAVDADGALYFSTGDGHDFNADTGGRNYGDSMLKIKLVNGKFQVVDYFTPYNQNCLDLMDLDFGSGAPLLVPGNNQIVMGSKEGRIYLVDRTNMGKFNASGDSQILNWVNINSQTCDGTGGGIDANSPPRIYGAASYWNGNVYIGGVFGPLRSYRTDNNTLAQTGQTPTIFEGSGQLGRGPQSTVSSNGNSNAIVWALSKKVQSDPSINNHMTLHAYDATDISHEIYSSDWNSSRDSLPQAGTVFDLPIVVNGKLYVVVGNSLYVYGLVQ